MKRDPLSVAVSQAHALPAAAPSATTRALAGLGRARAGQLCLIAALALACGGTDEPAPGAATPANQPERGGSTPAGNAPRAGSAGSPSGAGSASAPAGAPSPSSESVNRPLGGDALSAAEAASADGEASESPEGDEPAPSEDEEGLGDGDSSDAPESPDGDPNGDPALDPDLQFIAEDGYETFLYAVHCRSVGEDGSVIDESEQAELPVGDGRFLECETDSFPIDSALTRLDSTNAPWCVRGQLASYYADGDDRLSVSVESAPGEGPARLIGRREGEPITVGKAGAFGGTLWPLWITADYDAVEFRPAVAGEICEQTFGL